MADITDKFLSVGRRGTLTTLEAPGKPIGATSLKIRNPGNWPSDSLVAFSIRRVYIGGEDAGKEVPASYTEYTGILNPEDGSIDNLTLEAGEDQAYGTGPDVQVMIHISNTWAKKLVEGLGVVLTRAGELKNGIVRAAAIATGAVTEEKIATGAVTADKIASATITPAKMSNSRATDANGWTIGPDGWTKRIWVGSNPAIGGRTPRNLSPGQPLPSGMSPKQLSLQVSGTGTGGSSESLIFYPANLNGNSTSTSQTFDVMMVNIIDSTVTPANICIYLRAARV